MEPWSAAMFWISVRGEGHRHAHRQSDRGSADLPPVGAYNVFDGGLFQRGAEGANVMPGWRETVFHDIKMDEVGTPYVDRGTRTVIGGEVGGDGR